MHPSKDPGLCMFISGVTEYYCREASSYVIKVPQRLSGILSVSYRVNASIPGNLLRPLYKESVYVREMKEQWMENSGSVVEIQAPLFGTIARGNLEIEFSAHPVALESADHLAIGVLEVLDLTLQPSTRSLSSTQKQDVEPGSWFLSIQPQHTYEIGETGRTEGFSGYLSTTYIEFVLDKETLRKNRRMTSTSEKESKLYALEKLSGETHGNNQGTHTEEVDIHHNICIWASNRMDGQKQIWLNQIQAMDAAAFRFTWVLASMEDNLPEGSSTHERLKSISGVRVRESPLLHHPLHVEALEQKPTDGGEALSSSWTGKETEIVQYMSMRLEIAGYDVNRLSPPWCAQFYLKVMNFIVEESCDVVVFGNNRGSSGDAILVQVK